MIWRSTLVLLTSLTALTLPVESLRAEGESRLVSQLVDPSEAVDTGQTTPNIGQPNSSLPPAATSEQQIQEIKIVQQELKNRGYYNGPIDGSYGPSTAAAIRTLRGQESSQTEPAPSLFSPAAPDQTAAAQTESSAVVEPSAPVTEPDSSDSSNNPSEATQDDIIQLDSADIPDEDINIGDDVSPATGVDAPDATVSDSSDSADTQSGVLWPVLALIAVLGSFGIGFIWANRLKAKNKDETDSPWGAVPADVPQPPAHSLYNGHNGNGSDNASDVVVPSSHQSDDSRSMLAAVDNVSPTTRLAKIDVLDELVSNLQVSDPAQRRKAIWELGQRGNSSAVQPLVNSMVDADSKEKSLILAALSEIGIRSLKPMNRALAIALQDDNPDVRKNAIRDLTRVYDLVTQISQMLGHATEDEDPDVRRTAEWALEQLNRIREAPKLSASSMNALESARTPSELLPDEVENLKN
ncbi:MAG: HEAT repeat domain-containing protein [Leptolyngbyaceae cyanobacterium]